MSIPLIFIPAFNWKTVFDVLVQLILILLQVLANRKGGASTPTKKK